MLFIFSCFNWSPQWAGLTVCRLKRKHWDWLSYVEANHFWQSLQHDKHRLSTVPCIWKLRQTFCWNVNNWHHDWWSSGLQIYLKSRKQRSCLTLDKPLVVTKGAALGGHKCCHQSSKNMHQRYCHNLVEARISNMRDLRITNQQKKG